jgi:hypothetical protein
MAEFKLGRIKFVWKGSWSNATTYYVDDVVRYGGKTFICTVGHTAASDFYTDLNNVPTKWNQFTDGQDWKDSWTPSTLYKINDIVRNDGNTYICNTGHTSDSSLESDFEKWTLFGAGFNWTGNWTTSYNYKINDIVKYGGLVYLCNTAHVSAGTELLGLEDSLVRWDLFNESFDWKSDWDSDIRYKINDVVRYGGYTYICIEGHTSNATSLENDSGRWDEFHKGLDYKSDWSAASVRYKLNDLVKYGAGVWICIEEHVSSASFDTLKFSLFTEGIEFENIWNSGTPYQPGDIVRYGGNSYISKSVHTNIVPTTTATWDLFTTNFSFVGDYNGATSYKVGEVVRHGGYTYAAILDGVGQTPPNLTYWQQLNSGLRWAGEWQNSTNYILGDIVLYGPFSYICVLAHVSNDDDSTTLGDLTRSPATDIDGTFWNLLTAGLEESVLTTPGDLVYYSNAGVARLPVGTEGQVLVVENGVPAWKTWGESDNVYYVAAHGDDSPAPTYGLTLDKPWKTLRYAAEQVADGPKNPNAAYLLTQNRTFIQSEIIGWTNAQIAGNIAPFTSGFVYDQAKCQRDMGLLVDAVVYDLTHGGNEKIIDVAQAYFTALGVSYVSGQEDETVASINYGVSLIENVLLNEAPLISYQGGSPNLQIIDFARLAESTTVDTCQQLVRIVTDAIIAGDLDDLPTEIIAGFTINLKTGLYQEVLPIIVHPHTAIAGDELRSAKVSPAGKLIAGNDKAKSLAALAHLRSITDDIITNVAVTPTSGNTEIQNRTSQKAGSVGSTTALNSVISNTAEIKDIVVNGPLAASAYVYPDPTNWGTTLVNTAYAATGYATGDTAGFDDGRRLLLANKTFLQDEISEWILAQIAGSIAPFVGFTYSGTRRTNCERDVGYTVDALTYDLTYGGNLATQIAARAYYSLGTFVGTLPETQSLAVQLRIEDIIDNILTGDTAGWTKTTSLTQDVSGTPGSADSGAFAQDRIQQIYNTIDTGTEPTTILPYIAWVATALQTARIAINSAKAEIQSDSVQFIKKTYPTLVFDEVLCSRDIGYIVDAFGYDLMFGSNFLSIQSGLSYHRGTASTQVVLTTQLAAQESVIEYAGLKTQEIAASGAVVFADLLWSYILGYVNTGNRPSTTGTIYPTTSLDMINGANILRLNANFLAAEATAWIADNYSDVVTLSETATDTLTITDTSWMVAGDAIRFTGTVFGGVAINTTYYVNQVVNGTTFKISDTLGGAVKDLSDASGTMGVAYYYNDTRCQNDVKNYVEAIARDLTFTGNYNVVLAARYYRNALTGSKLEDMFYVANGCGLRNMTVLGLDGSSDGNTTGVQDALSAPNEYGTRRPNAGAYVSLNPGYNPNDTKVWVTNKSTYVQNITTFGNGATGQKIDGSLHAGGNDSIVSNDFTQVISDGIGAWVTNLGRAELVSVFSYYAHIGYLAENGGKIRATNGNNSYGDFGSVSEGVDVTENAITATINNRGNQANVGNVITNGTGILILEYANAGIEYSTADYTISGSGLNAEAIGDETRDGGIFQVRLTDPGDSSGPGGTGYVTAGNVAQAGNTTQITIAATDAALSTAYVGMSVYITAGTGAGQYGYINTYNSGSKIATIYKDSTDTAGWDHVVPGTPIAASLDLTTQYQITPRITFSEPPYFKTVRTGLTVAANWTSIVYGDAVGEYTNISSSGGSGSAATFDVVRKAGVYTVTINSAGFNYDEDDALIIAGTSLGGTTPANDVSVTVTSVDGNSGGILEVTIVGSAISGQWVALASGTNQAYSSPDGETWTAGTLPATANWSSVAYGPVNGFGYWVAVARNSDTFAYSTNGTVWTISSSVDAGEPWDWCDIAYGNGRFVAIAESDSAASRRAVSTDGGATWTAGTVASGAIAISYGLGRFVLVEGNFSNSAAYSTDGVFWNASTLPANSDSTESNWRDLAYGNGRFVAIADNDAQVAISLNGTSWISARLPLNADWRRISYGNGVFLATTDNYIAASSNDGINWTSRELYTTDIDILSTSKDSIIDWSAGIQTSSGVWNGIGYGDGKYVAVGGDGTTPRTSYSFDGISWNTGTFPAGGDGPYTIAYGGGVWVSPLFNSNDAATSADGITFTFQNNVLPATREWGDITYANGYFVTVDRSGTTSVAYSTDGVTWTAGILSASVNWTSVAGGTVGSTNYFVAVSGTTSNSTVASYSVNNGATWTAATLPASDRWNSVTFGNGRFVAVSGNSGSTSTNAAYSTNGGQTWIAATLPGAAAGWTNVVWNGSVFIATAFNTNRSAISEDGITWVERAMSVTANWIDSAADPDAYEVVVISTGSTAIRKITYQANTNYLTVHNTNLLSINDRIVVPADSAGVEVFGNLVTDTIYYVTAIVDSTRFTISTGLSGSSLSLSTGVGSMFANVYKDYTALAYGKGNNNNGFIVLGRNSKNAVNVYVGTRAKARSVVIDERLFEIWISEPGSNYNSNNPPTMTIADPNNTGGDAAHEVRIGNGVLAQPTITNRGTGYNSAAATVVGDGFADNYQVGSFVNFNNISEIPKIGSNLQIDGIDDVFYKIVTIRNLAGITSFSALIQISPPLGTLEAPEHATSSVIRSRFSQVRLTGHDFLDIGTGNQVETNYPGIPSQDPVPGNETVQSNGGRIFWTSTDQDGNFRVGGLFNVEQATGTATLNAEAFNIAGLNELSLGSVALGGGGATITEFSTDPFFTADSDSVIPTQRAIKAYISSQIGGGSGSLNVNTITAGAIFIAGNSITTTTNELININTTVNFTGGVDGYPVALNMFLQG